VIDLPGVTLAGSVLGFSLFGCLAYPSTLTVFGLKINTCLICPS
jgi:hypothetical protein